MAGLPDWSLLFGKLREYAEDGELPSVSLISHEGGSPFRILVSTVLSLRTRDDVTLKTSRSLFAKASTPAELLKLDEDTIAELIFPSGFYKTKAKNLLKIAEILQTQFKGEVPAKAEDLLTLPGVGRKSANLVLNLAFGIKAICVDTHVHRIANRMGWTQTEDPEQTEFALQKILPEEYWIEANELLVTFGQDICKPASPHCTTCFFTALCPKVGVLAAR